MVAGSIEFWQQPCGNCSFPGCWATKQEWLQVEQVFSSCRALWYRNP